LLVTIRDIHSIDIFELDQIHRRASRGDEPAAIGKQGLRMDCDGKKYVMGAADKAGKVAELCRRTPMALKLECILELGISCALQEIQRKQTF
jgi:hypothetical protein